MQRIPRDLLKHENELNRRPKDEAVRQAVEGVRRPVPYRAKQVHIQGEPLFEIEFSDHF
jgi:hypothetical protein